jgi:polyisoprenoid-binding protein YceI
LIEFDPASQTGQIDVQVQTASLDTGYVQRDEILKGADWFDIAQYPVMRYRSQRFVFEGSRLVAAEGELTLHGITRPLRLEVVRFKCGLNLAARKRGCGADATAVLRRSDFGIRTGLPFVGDEVRLLIQIEAYAE